MQQRTRHSAQREGVVAVALADQRRTHTDQNDTDVLHTRIGQQTFDIVLQRCEDNAPQTRYNTQCQHHRTRRHHHCRACELDGQRKRHSDNTVDTRFDHHARHYRRHVRRCCGVSLRQPRVHREHTRLHTETHHKQCEQRQRRVSRHIATQCRKCSLTRTGIEQCKTGQQSRKTDVHHHQIGQRCTHRFALIGIEDNQQERGDGHHLPTEQETETTRRRNHSDHRHVEHNE